MLSQVHNIWLINAGFIYKVINYFLCSFHVIFNVNIVKNTPSTSTIQIIYAVIVPKTHAAYHHKFPSIRL